MILVIDTVNKMAIKILTDSSSDITKEQAKQLNVELLAMPITFGLEEYYDGEDLSKEEFYNKLVASGEVARTSQITPFRYEEAMQKIVDNGDVALVITLSSKLSATYQSAISASEKFGDKVRVVDSLNASSGVKVLIEYALRLIESGKDIDEIVALVEENKKRVQISAVVDTLTYLQRGGRISKAVAIAGSILKIHPVVAVLDGEVKVVGKAMGTKKSNALLNQLLKERGGLDYSMPTTFIYAGNDKTLLNKYKEDSKDFFEIDYNLIPDTQIGATIGTHVGPGTVGIAGFKKI